MQCSANPTSSKWKLSEGHWKIPYAEHYIRLKKIKSWLQKQKYILALIYKNKDKWITSSWCNGSGMNFPSPVIV